MIWIDYWYVVLIIPAIILSLIASAMVKTTFNKYNKIRVGSNINANLVVERMLANNDIYDVEVKSINGKLTDNYNPRNKTLNLSQSTSGGNTIGAIGVAAHEAGHAIQFKQGYFPVRLRSAMVPVVNIGSYLGYLLIIVGLFINSASSGLLINLGVAFYSLAFIFTLITLPVEFNASRRAVKSLDGMGVMSNEELSGVKKVLSAAAFTYVAAMITALASLVRILLIVSGNRGRRN